MIPGLGSKCLWTEILLRMFIFKKQNENNGLQDHQGGINHGPARLQMINHLMPDLLQRTKYSFATQLLQLCLESSFFFPLVLQEIELAVVKIHVNIYGTQILHSTGP
ncbi:hypothetical protein ABZP36_019279 [Zizania latifolia]